MQFSPVIARNLWVTISLKVRIEAGVYPSEAGRRRTPLKAGRTPRFMKQDQGQVRHVTWATCR